MVCRAVPKINNVIIGAVCQFLSEKIEMQIGPCAGVQMDPSPRNKCLAPWPAPGQTALLLTQLGGYCLWMGEKSWTHVCLDLWRAPADKSLLSVFSHSTSVDQARAPLIHRHLFSIGLSSGKQKRPCHSPGTHQGIMVLSNDRLFVLIFQHCLATALWSNGDTLLVVRGARVLGPHTILPLGVCRCFKLHTS